MPQEQTMPARNRRIKSFLICVLLISNTRYVANSSPKCTDQCWKSGKNPYLCIPQRCVGRVARRRSAKPVTVVRFRYAPPKMPLQLSVGAFAFQNVPTFSQFHKKCLKASFECASRRLRLYISIGMDTGYKVNGISGK